MPAEFFSLTSAPSAGEEETFQLGSVADFHVPLQLRDLFQGEDVSINTRCPLCFNLSKQLLKGGTKYRWRVCVCVLQLQHLFTRLSSEKPGLESTGTLARFELCCVFICKNKISI